MKKILIIPIFILLLSTISFAEISRTYYFEIDTLNLVQDSIYTRIEIEDGVVVGQPGHPSLPYRGISLLLPQEQSITGVSIRTSGEVFLDSCIVYPIQMPRAISDTSAYQFTEPDSEVYGSTDPYPSEQNAGFSTHFLAGYSVGFLAVTPFRYIPATGELSYFEQIDVTIHTAYYEAAENAVNSFLYNNPEIEKRIRNLVENYDDIDAFYNVTRERPDSAYDYIIVTADDFVDDFQPLADFHSRRGYRTKIETIEYIYATYSGVDEPDQLRNYFIDQFTENQMLYVLLGGDDDIIKHRGLYANTGRWIDYDVAADLYFACLDGNWDEDGDGIYGEIEDNPDLTAEFCIGRICINGINEIENFINKTIMYSETPVITGAPTELKSALLLGELMSLGTDTWGYVYMNELIGNCNANGYETEGVPDDGSWTIETLYDFDYWAPITYSGWDPYTDLLPRLSEGYNLVNHMGHSGETHSMKLYNSDITNENIGNNGINANFSIYYTQGCYAGAFEYSDCFSEKMTTIENGAVAMISNSAVGLVNWDDTNTATQFHHRQFIDAIFGEGIYNLGNIIQDSKEDAIPLNMGDTINVAQGAMYHSYYEINLFGDPALMVWTDIPGNLTADYPDTITLNTDSISVTVPGVEYARISIYDDETIYGYGVTDDTGVASVVFDNIPNEIGEINISIVAHNYYTYIDTIIVYANWYIDVNGDNSNSGSYYYPFATIQHGIDSAEDGDVVLVNPGIYYENVAFNGKNITVSSQYIIESDDSHISGTIIDGSGNGEVVKFVQGEETSAKLIGLTIQNGTKGIYCANYSSPTIKNNVIRNCGSPGELSGGIYIDGASPEISKSTITENNPGDGGGAYCCNNSSADFENCIFWDNSPYEIISENSTITVTYSDIQGGYIGVGNIDADPLFVNPGNGNYHLQPGSPCINTGNPDTPLDPDGTTADMGAFYTHQIIQIWYVSPDGNDQHSGSEQYPFATIQKGIDTANGGDTVLVLSGTYYENIQYCGKNVTVGSQFLTTMDESYISTTVINGDGVKSVVTFQDGESNDAVLIGFTIENGSGNSHTPPGYSDLLECGGGVFIYDADPSISNVHIINNTSDVGAGIFCNNSDPILTELKLTDNVACNEGGGIWFNNSEPILTDVTIKGNSVTDGYGFGGGIYFTNSIPTFDTENHCNIFLNNAFSGKDIFALNILGEPINVILDTFTVKFPTDYYATPIVFFNFDVQYGIIEQIEQDLYVNPVNGDNSNSGLTQDDAFKTIDFAFSRISAYEDNIQSIHLAEGTYSPYPNEEIFPINCISYVLIVGNGEDVTFLDAEQESRVMYYFHDENSMISQMTLQNGTSAKGGGIYFDYSESVYLADVTVRWNSAATEGGGIYFSYTDTISLTNVTVTDNSASDYGGGMYFDHSDRVSLVNVTVSDNSISGYYGFGGGIHCKYSSPTLTDVILDGNSASYGGGIACEYSSPNLTNVTINDNTANGAGGIYCEYSSPNLTNVNISGNTAISSGGGIRCLSCTSPNLINCILWNNDPEEIYFCATGTPNTITISFSDIKDGLNGIVTNNNGTVNWLEGNISDNPCFADPANDDYSLLWNIDHRSPCIDTGDPNTEWDEDDTPPDMGAIPAIEHKYDNWELPPITVDNGWKWMSFPALDTLTNSDDFDGDMAEYMLEDILYYYILDHVEWKPYAQQPDGIYYIAEPGYWTNLDHIFTSPQGYKFQMNSDEVTPLEISGFLEEPDTEFTLIGVGEDNWIGYFIDETQTVEDAFGDNMDNLYYIQTQDWAMARIKPSPGSPWIIPPGDRTFSYGDMVIVKCFNDDDAFSWNYSGLTTDPYEKSETEYFNYTEQADYVPLFIELDTENLPVEIGVFVDSTCKGAAAVEDTLTQANAYILDGSSGEIELELYYEDKSLGKRIKEYFVLDQKTMVREKRTIKSNEYSEYYIIFLIEDESETIPKNLSIHNFPNPFSLNTNIQYALPEETEINISIYNIKGHLVKRIVKGKQSPRIYNVIWDGKDEKGKSISNGIYLYRIETKNKTILKKMLLLR